MSVGRQLINVDTFTGQRKYLMGAGIDRPLSNGTLEAIGAEITFQDLKRLDLAIHDELEKLSLLPGDEDVTRMITKLRNRKSELFDQVNKVLDGIDERAEAKVQQTKDNKDLLQNFKDEISVVCQKYWKQANTSEEMVAAIAATRSTLGIK